MDDKVSIRAPVKGATTAFSDPRTVADVSIRAPVKGATSTIDDARRAAAAFRSAPP